MAGRDFSCQSDRGDGVHSLCGLATPIRLRDPQAVRNVRHVSQWGLLSILLDRVLPLRLFEADI